MSHISTYVWVTFLHMNESRFYIWMSHISTYVWVTFLHMNESHFYIWMSHISTYVWVTFLHMNESHLYIWMSHISTYEWGMSSHMNEPHMQCLFNLAHQLLRECVLSSKQSGVEKRKKKCGKNKHVELRVCLHTARAHYKSNLAQHLLFIVFW